MLHVCACHDRPEYNAWYCINWLVPYPLIRECILEDPRVMYMCSGQYCGFHNSLHVMFSGSCAHFSLCCSGHLLYYRGGESSVPSPVGSVHYRSFQLICTGSVLAALGTPSLQGSEKLALLYPFSRQIDCRAV